MKLRISKRERVIIVFTAMTVIATIVFITLGRYSGSLGGVAHASIAKPQDVYKRQLKLFHKWAMNIEGYMLKDWLETLFRK